MDLKIMLEKQRKLDKYISTNKNLGYEYDPKFKKNRVLALRVEIAELANTTRCFKYWSNKGPESDERILDEAADVLHFILSLINLTNIEVKNNVNDVEDYTKDLIKDKYVDLTLGFNTTFELVDKEDWEGVLINLIAIIIVLGFDLVKLEKAYEIKYKENIKRQQEGY